MDYLVARRDIIISARDTFPRHPPAHLCSPPPLVPARLSPSARTLWEGRKVANIFSSLEAQRSDFDGPYSFSQRQESRGILGHP